MMRSVLIVLALATYAYAQSKPIWLEGEAAVRTNAKPNRSGWGAKQHLSKGDWLTLVAEADKVNEIIPEAGATFGYDFTSEDGKYDLWLRLGYESARAPIKVRIDNAEWIDVSPTQLTTDLMAIADFAEVAWLKIGTPELKDGKHTLDVLIPRPTKPSRILFGLDAILLTPVPFLPNGPHLPGTKWLGAKDIQAAGMTAEFAERKENTDPAKRETLDLSGLWQVARFDEPGEIVDRTGPTPLPAKLDDLHWKAAVVPGNKDADRDDLAYCHRLLFRTRVNVPKELAGRAFVLRFPCNALLSTVYVNGVSVGTNDTPGAAFECDATAAVKPGSTNEIIVAIKDHYYAISKTDDGRGARSLFNLPPDRFFNSGGLGAVRYADYPTMFKMRSSGILEPPTFEVRGVVHVSNVFCKPRVGKKTLDVDVALTNTTATERTVSITGEVKQVGADGVVLAIPAQDVTIPAGGSKTITLSQPWTTGKLWWPDEPVLHELTLTVTANGVSLDRSRTTFGFREWGTAGNQFTLNGIPWRFRADLRHNGPTGTPDAAVAEWKKHGQNMMRYWGTEPWTGRSQADTLDYFDRNGIAVRRSGIFDGEVASYQLVIDGKPHAALFDNWRKQLAAWVKAERNHPSVFVWSLENEITYINTRNFGWLKIIEPEIEKAVKMVQELDPTRPVMIDGGDALMSRSLPVYGNHYLEQDKRDYPGEAYTLSRAYGREKNPRSWDPWPIHNDKPLFLGESYFANGAPPAEYAEVIGEQAFLGRRDASAGVTRFARMLSEGYRWHGVAAFHFWFAEGANEEHYIAWQPVAVLCREWDTTFAGGTTVKRNLKVLNDTRLDTPITVYWLLQTSDGKNQVRGKREFQLAPGGAEEFVVDLAVPSFGAGDTPMTLVLSATRGGKEVFRDARNIRVVPPIKKPVVNAPAGEIAVYDPKKSLAPMLKKLVADSTPIDDWKNPPAGTKLLIVGPDAVGAKESADPAWVGLLARGINVLVLDQAHPLRYLAVPAPLEPTSFTGSIAFPENLAHPAFSGLATSDFFTRTGDGTVYRNVYRKPQRGARSLMQCDRELGCSALIETSAANHVMLLCQVPMTKRDDDPVCLRLLGNLIGYASKYTAPARKTTVVMKADDPRAVLLKNSGLQATFTDDIALSLKSDVAIVDATAANLQALAEKPDELTAYFTAGGQLVLWGVAPDGLASFNKIVGIEHAMRPFKMERVNLTTPRASLLAGVTVRDVAMESSEKIYPWAGDRYPAADTFTHVVDLDDIAPFVQAETSKDGWNKMTNGLTSADSWKFIFYHDQATEGAKPVWRGKLPRKQELRGFSIIINTDYRKITKLKVTFDNDDTRSETFGIKPEAELKQSFGFGKPQACGTVTLEPIEWTEGSKPVLGVDNLWLWVNHPAERAEKIVPMLNIGTLVQYPRGKGGVVLNQLNVPAKETNPENADKRANIASNLLRNLGCAFAPEKLLLPGVNLVSVPIPLGEKCNSYLTGDKGFLPGQPDLGHFPVGEQRFDGLRFDIRNFRTSPLPAAITLDGKSKEVSGIPVDSMAEALFFLHTFHVTKPPKDGETPVVFEYVVTYADGSTATVPVKLGVDIGVLNNSGDVKAPSAASIAWQAAYPMAKDRTAAVYAQRWVNPKPTMKITSLAMRWPEKGAGQHGTPFLLGATAADEKK